MGKIGRNDPCPCGSGKKFKRCCLLRLDRLPEPLLADAVTLAIHSLFAQNHRKIAQTQHEEEQVIAARRRQLLEDSSQDIEGLAEKLVQHACWAEQKIRDILRSHSPVFWLSLHRRFPAYLELDTVRTLRGHELALLRDVRTLTTSQFFKHGTWELEDWKPNIDNTLNIEPSRHDVIRLWGTLRPYLDELFNVPIRYRQVSKGARIYLDEQQRLQVVASKDLERTTTLYQNRRHKFSQTSTTIGTATGIVASYPDDPTPHRRSSSAMLFFDINSDKEISFSLPHIPTLIRAPAFRPAVADLSKLFRSLRPFEKKVLEATGLKVDELRLSFAALKNYILDFFSGPGGYTCLNRAAIFAETKYLFERLSLHLRKAAEEESVSIDVDRVIGVFVPLLGWRSEDKWEYDVFVPGDTRCVLNCGVLTLIDLTLVPFALNHALFNIQLDNEMRQVKGSEFERVTAEELAADLPGISFPMKPGLSLKRRGEKDPYVQFDVYVEKKGLLIVVECKAYSLTRGYFRGERRDVTKRWAQVSDWIREADSRASLLAKYPRGANYEIPPTVTHVIPVVCSSFAEFIWSVDEGYLLPDESIPRVCTYPELVGFIKRVDRRHLLGKQFVLPIEHGQ